MSPRAAPKGLRAKGGRFIPGHRWAACARTNSRVVGISQPPEKNQCYATERGWGSSPVQCPSCNLSAPEGIKFCGMVGSSALATRLDPEEQGNVIAAFHACCADEIKSFGGTVAQYLGDG